MRLSVYWEDNSVTPVPEGRGEESVITGRSLSVQSSDSKFNALRNNTANLMTNTLNFWVLNADRFAH